MRTKKLMNDSFFINNENLSAVTYIDKLTPDLYFHYTKDSTQWKLSGNTPTLASNPIPENMEIFDTISLIIKQSRNVIDTRSTLCPANNNRDYVYTFTLYDIYIRPTYAPIQIELLIVGPYENITCIIPFGENSVTSNYVKIKNYELQGHCEQIIAGVDNVSIVTNNPLYVIILEPLTQ